MAAIKPIRRQGLPDRLAEELMTYVVNNSFKPGDKLPSTKKLSEMFGVGYPTLREALKMLETVGALIIRHGSGIFVSEQIEDLFIANPLNRKPSPRILLDHLQVMSVLEPQALMLLAERATEEDLTYLENLMSQEAELIGEDDVVDLHMKFHIYTAKASGNIVLYELMKVTSKIFAQEEELLPKLLPVAEEDYTVRVDIIKALRAKDGPGAAKLIHDHLLIAIDRLAAKLAKMDIVS
jgi:GntR family transcriptional regulator, transcriptional repressor for pyruvate dehydrogenase complex